MKHNILTLALFATSATSFAQDTATAPAPPSLTFSGYADVYYQFDAGNPLSNNRPAYIYSYNRNNEVNLNLGFIKAAYNTDKVRANLALMTGTYASANLAAEPDVLRHIYESNIGVKLSAKKNVWLDAGVFASHIGFESAVGKDCWNLTRSLLADNSPYYETGVKLGYTSDNGRWLFSALVLNGWQHIKKPDGNSIPSFGWQVTYKPSANVTFNSSSFIGNEKPDSSRQMRYFHNFYGIYQVTKKLGVITGFDIGAEQKADGLPGYNTWYAPVLIVRYATGSKTAVAVRGEYYADKNGVIIAVGTAGGFKTTGASANFDYAFLPNVLWRIEGKLLHGTNPYFEQRDNSFSQNNLSFTTALSVGF